MTGQDFLTSKLLIAMPNMTDPRFEKSVILICSHDATHAMGIVVNKPMENIEIVELYEKMGVPFDKGSNDRAVFFGGPVKPDRGVVVHSLDHRLESTVSITKTVGLTSSKDILVDIAKTGDNAANSFDHFLAIGHAGWAPGQLESEIAANAWAHCEADDELIFAKDRTQVWSAAMQKLGVTEAMFSMEWSTTRSQDTPLN